MHVHPICLDALGVRLPALHVARDEQPLPCLLFQGGSLRVAWLLCQCTHVRVVVSGALKQWTAVLSAAQTIMSLGVAQRHRLWLTHWALQGLENSMAGMNALDVSQVLTGLAGIFSEREKGQPLPLRLLHLLEAHACSLLPTFSPMVRLIR